MCVRERLLTGILKVQIHESENIYDWQAQLDKADVEMHRRLGGFNFQRRRLSTFFYRDDDIVSTSSRNIKKVPIIFSSLWMFLLSKFIKNSK